MIELRQIYGTFFGLMLVVNFFVVGCLSKQTPAVDQVSPKLDDDLNRSPSGTSSGSGTSSEKKSEKAWFRDQTKSSGIQFTYRNGREGSQYTILETVGGGVALFDMDQDGDIDAFFPGGGQISKSSPSQISGRPCGLFRNDGTGRFSDVSGQIVTTGPLRYSHGAFVSDFNRDGFPDLLMTGYDGCTLFRNDSGSRLVDITEASGLSLKDWTTAAAWADINHDGWSDVLIVSYLDWSPDRDVVCRDSRSKIRDVCPPQRFPPARQRLFINNQNGAFTEAHQPLKGSGLGKSLGCVALDLNSDGWIDFYVANDQVDNQLYLGGPELPMNEVGRISATSGSELGVPEGSMGVDAADYDGDGLADLWVTNYELEDNSLYHNDGQGQFRHATVRAGLGGIGRPQVGFGTGFGDFDLDGWLDLYVVNGHVLYETGRSHYLQTPFLLRNEQDKNSRRFRDVTMIHGGEWFQGRYAGRGSAMGDLDNDGDLDLIVVQQNNPVSVLMNQTQPKNWLRFELRGVTSDPDAVGAVLRFQLADREIVRHIRSGSGYLSHSDQRILIPSDDPASSVATVTWLTGKSERFTNLKTGSTIQLREGTGESQ